MIRAIAIKIVPTPAARPSRFSHRGTRIIGASYPPNVIPTYAEGSGVIAPSGQMLQST
jgi:hypothetical protein